MSNVIEEWVHLRTVSLTAPAPTELDGKLVSFAVDAVGRSADRAESEIGREHASQQSLDALLSGPESRFEPFTAGGRVVSEPGFKDGVFLGANRSFFREERRRLETALHAAETA